MELQLPREIALMLLTGALGFIAGHGFAYWGIADACERQCGFTLGRTKFHCRRVEGPQ